MATVDRMRVAVKTSEGITVHCRCGYGDYDTLCGIDSNDPAIGHLGVVPAFAEVGTAAFDGGAGAIMRDDSGLLRGE
jgi:hypothetical protein